MIIVHDLSLSSWLFRKQVNLSRIEQIVFPWNLELEQMMLVIHFIGHLNWEQLNSETVAPSCTYRKQKLDKKEIGSEKPHDPGEIEVGRQQRLFS